MAQNDAQDDFEEMGEEIGEEFMEDMEGLIPIDIACAKQYPVYLASLIDLNNFSTYWVDIFVKNFCHLQAIFEIDDKIDEIQQDIREAYYACESDKASEYWDEYVKTTMELFFVRNLIPFDTRPLLSKDTERVMGSVYKNIDGQLYNDMWEEFVEKKAWVNSEEFIELFEQFKDEYEDNLEGFVFCVEDSWGAIIEKWEDLTKTFAQLKLSDEEKEFDLGEAKPPDVKFSAKSSAAEQLQKNIDATKKELAEFKPSIYVSDSYTGGSSVAYFDEYADEIRNYAIAVTEGDLLDKYRLLYGAGSEVSYGFTEKLKDFQTILNATSKPVIVEAKKQSRKVSKKQCGD